MNRQYNDEVRREQNIFNKYEAQRAREFNQQMDSTKYQRTVNDMQQAGVNPALAMNGGISTQATSNAQASSAAAMPAPVDLTAVADMAMQAKQLKIQEKLADAEVRLKNAEAENKETANSYADEYYRLRNAGMNLSNDLTEEQKKQIIANIGKAKAETDLIVKQADTEVQRKALTEAQTRMQYALEEKTDAEIAKLVQLLPFEKRLMEAQTQHQRAQAAMAMAEAAYQNGLIDAGMISAVVAESQARARGENADALRGEIENDLKTGNFFNNPKYMTPEEVASGAKDFAGDFSNGMMKFMSGFGHMVKNFVPISISKVSGTHSSSSESRNVSRSYNESSVTRYDGDAGRAASAFRRAFGK